MKAKLMAKRPYVLAIYANAKAPRKQPAHTYGVEFNRNPYDAEKYELLVGTSKDVEARVRKINSSGFIVDVLDVRMSSVP